MIGVLAYGSLITLAKAGSLIFQYQLRHVTEAGTDMAVLVTLAKARYWKDASNLAFSMESPLVRAAIPAKIRDRGVFADISLSGEILKVARTVRGSSRRPALSDVAKVLAKKLKKHGVDEGAVRKAIKDCRSTFAEAFIKERARVCLRI